ncbi:HD domain-containing protein [Streptomyces sp. SID3343]|uniref:HD domain-containing protein n=1 Tax=Streptomyces sp. SID3343 TaxID=2690260 RepID=UPI0031F98CF9
MTAVELRPLPAEAATLLDRVAAPARLVAHLRIVHDVAYRLCDWVAATHPHVPFDRDTVLFGAATHDIGKALYPEELSGPGACHEQAGYDLLTAHGVAPTRARFARTHASWDPADPEELLVSLADKVWKGKRVPELEQALITLLATASGLPEWETYQALDDFVTAIDPDTLLL